MPVKLEHITQPTPDDWNDLIKIQGDTSPEGPVADPSEWLGEDQWYICGRFNDRIIGALQARRSGDQVHLIRPGVRTITQRRGVLHQMIHFMQTWATSENLTLTVEADCALRTALESRGFRLNGELLEYKAL
ncbi:acetyl-CoA sensor PanZ family protein [Thalassolituus sp.]|uniref:acetyl-CoA sensor PanZ family protein n=1 Tax=Thalassolituus sp. TaxID=2030822 RepID=UPI003513CF44